MRVLGKDFLPCKLVKEYSGPVRVSVRPEHIELSDPAPGAIAGEIKIATFLGDFINYEVRLESGQVIQVNQYVHLDRVFTHGPGPPLRCPSASRPAGGFPRRIW